MLVVLIKNWLYTRQFKLLEVNIIIIFHCVWGTLVTGLFSQRAHSSSLTADFWLWKMYPFTRYRRTQNTKLLTHHFTQKWIVCFILQPPFKGVILLWENFLVQISIHFNYGSNCFIPLGLCLATHCLT